MQNLGIFSWYQECELLLWGLFCFLEGAQNNHWKVGCIIIAMHSKIINLCIENKLIYFLLFLFLLSFVMLLKQCSIIEEFGLEDTVKVS